MDHKTNNEKFVGIKNILKRNLTISHKYYFEKFKISRFLKVTTSLM